MLDAAPKSATLSSLAVGDVDGDGHQGVIMGEEKLDYETQSLPFSRLVSFKSGSDLRAPWNMHAIDTVRCPHSVDVADLDGDGELEIIVGEHDPFWPYMKEGANDLTITFHPARVSLVLLKNDDLLPLRPDLGSVAVVGPAAHSRRLLQEDYRFLSHLEDLFMSAVSPDSPNLQAEFTEPMEAYFPPSITVLEGSRAAVSPEMQVSYAQGCDIAGAATVARLLR